MSVEPPCLPKSEDRRMLAFRRKTAKSNCTRIMKPHRTYILIAALILTASTAVLHRGLREEFPFGGRFK